jgi:PTH1 family peptidyl-tRNA hydrolase
MDLSFGKLRFKHRGGDGGHQGVRSIIESMGGSGFLRLKVGIGRPPKGVDPAEYVLTSFDDIERSQLDGILSRAAESLVVVFLEGIEAAMNRYQRKSGMES